MRFRKAGMKGARAFMKGKAAALGPSGRRHSRIARDERGAVVVMTALFMTVLLAFAALVVDVGYLYLEKSKLRAAVDAAALAGVQELPGSPTAAQTTAKAYAAMNGAAQDGVTVEILNGSRGLRVSAAKDVNLFFARIFGADHIRVSASAAAEIGTVSGMRGLAPFGVVKQDFVYGGQYYLKYGPGQGVGSHHGNFGALALGGRGAANYRKNIMEGYEGKLTVGQWVDTEPGNMSGPTVDGVDYRISSCTHVPECTFDNFVPGCTKVVYAPVIDSLDVHGRGKVQVVGFAAFFLEGNIKSGADNYVVGRFIKMLVDGDIGDAGDYGVSAVRLTE